YATQSFTYKPYLRDRHSFPTRRSSDLSVVTGVECLLPRRHNANGINRHIGAEATRELTNLCHYLRIFTLAGELRGINNIGGSEFLRPIKLLRININRDDFACSSELGAGDSCHANATQSKDRNRFTTLDIS